MRETLIVGNWKMNGSFELIQSLTSDLKEAFAQKQPGCTVGICPPFVYLSTLKSAVEGSPIKIGGQNVSEYLSGAYTGETSAPMLKELGADFGIVGHSERRTYYAETDAGVNTKSKVLLDHGIRPIICVGETLEEREAGNHEQIVVDQVKKALEGFSSDQLSRSVIAYEPVWAIGTGKTATPEQANSMHQVIRKQVAADFGTEAADKIPILYGGSVKGSNAEELLGQSDIDGALVGGASLKADDFSAIINAG